MTLPKGLKAFLKDSSPGKLTKGKFKGYRAVDAHGAFEGPTLKGITKQLAAKLYSRGELDDAATASTEWTPDAWKSTNGRNGSNGGLRRGRAVDSQVSRLASASANARKTSSKFKFTTLAFSALAKAGLEPVVGQRVVLSRRHGVATAADVVCFDAASNALVVVELKCGFSGCRTAPVRFNRRAQKLNLPCSGADDCLLHRHMSQLAVTRHLLATEGSFAATLASKFGIREVRGSLLYVCDRDTQLHALTPWWVRRGAALVRLLGEK